MNLLILSNDEMITQEMCIGTPWPWRSCVLQCLSAATPASGSLKREQWHNFSVK